MAQRTGLEPATPGVTGRYSNRLNYRCVSLWTCVLTRLIESFEAFNLEPGKPDPENMAQRTGLEPATPGVTGRYSNRLNYRCASVEAFQLPSCFRKTLKKWWVMTGSNRRHSACKADALPAELITLCFSEAAKFTHLTKLSQ